MKPLNNDNKKTNRSVKVLEVHAGDRRSLGGLSSWIRSVERERDERKCQRAMASDGGERQSGKRQQQEKWKVSRRRRSHCVDVLHLFLFFVVSARCVAWRAESFESLSNRNLNFISKE